MKLLLSQLLLNLPLFFLCSSILFLYQTKAQLIEDHTEIPEETDGFINFVPTKEISDLGDDLFMWLGSENVAIYGGFRKIHSVVIPIHVNLILIGFDGDGNRGIHLSRHDIEPWLEHIEHTLPHLIIPLGEEQLTTQIIKTPTLPVKYKYTTRVIKLSQLITTVLEDAIFWHLRSDDPLANEHQVTSEKEQHRDYFYVDAFKFSSLLNSLLKFLKLDNAYTLFILNPKPPVESSDSYGYRVGFSEPEISFLYQNFDYSTSSFSDLYYPTETHPTEEQLPELEKVKELENYTIHWKDMTRESELWAKEYLSRFTNVTNRNGLNDKAKMKKCGVDGEEEDDPNCTFDSIMDNKKLSIIEKARRIAETGTLHEKKYLRLVQLFDFVHENCLVDAWIGHGRFAFVDLTAGPFEWGPTIAGEGIRDRTSRPVVPTLKHKSHHLDEERFKTAEKFDSTSTVEDNSNEKEDSSETEQKKPSETQNTELKETDKNSFLREMASKYKRYCTEERSVRISPKICQVWAKIMKKYGIPLTAFDIVGDSMEGEHSVFELDNFLSKLAVMMSKTYRHLITPPTPLFTTPFCSEMTFEFFVIKDHNSYQPLDAINFDFNEFRHEISKFRLPGQKFTFRSRELNQFEIDEVMMSVLDSRRVAVLPRLTPEGEFFLERVAYFDSQTLHNSLSQFLESHFEFEKRSISKNSKTIPIVLISLNESEPVFIDKYYTAKAMHNMVLIVQSNFPNWKSRMFCNNKTIVWNLKNPLKSALAATMLSVAGLIPHHLSYNEAKQHATQDWMWSVGDNPFAATTVSAHHFSKFHKDIAYRNYVIHSITEAVKKINQGIDTLESLSTTKANYEEKNNLPFQTLFAYYNQTLEYFTQLSLLVERLNFTGAVSLLQRLEESALLFRRATNEASSILEMHRCTQRETEEGSQHDLSRDWIIPFFIAFDLFAILITIIWCRRPKEKLKVN